MRRADSSEAAQGAKADRRSSGRFSPDQPDAELLSQVVDFYCEALRGDAQTLAFLHSLGFQDGGALHAQRLGLCDRTLGLCLPEANRKAGAALREQLTRLGVLRPSGHEHLRGCITLPIRDERGVAVDILGFPLGRRRGDVLPSLAISGAVPEAYAERSLASWSGAGGEQPAADGAVLVNGDPARGQDSSAEEITSKRPEPSEPDAPASSDPAPEIEVTEAEVRFTCSERVWRVRGLERNLGHNRLRVTLRVSRGERFHIDSIELYQARQRASFTKQAATELGLGEEVVKQDLGKLLLHIERIHDERIRAALAPTKVETAMTDAERSAALALLEASDLLDRITADFTRCGVVGESVNAQVAYLAAVSRKLEDPLAILIQSSSAAGKSSLMDAVLAFVPAEDRVTYSAMTGQSLFYLGRTDLKHKVLAVAEEQGVAQASYALKLLQSQGELTIASTGKDPATGRLLAQEYRVEGPVAMFMTSTAIDIDDELLSRCIVLAVDEGRQQTRAIHALQRRKQTLLGLEEAQEREHVLTVHRNAQRLLQPLHVVNPFADRLSFADHQTRTRRDHAKYLALIQAVALLYQHQRQVHETLVAGESLRYVEATEGDIAVANKLAHAVLGRSLDELPPQTRRLLTEIHELLVDESSKQGIPRSELRFQRRWLRERLGWGDTQLKVHLRRLVELELLVPHRLHEQRATVYELLYDGQGQGGERFALGLIDPGVARGAVAESMCEYEAAAASNGRPESASGRPSVGLRSALGRRVVGGV